MAYLETFLIYLVLFVAAEVLRPKPNIEDAQATPFTEARLPQVDPARRAAVVWGRVRVDALHVMSVTQYQAVPIRADIKTGLFSSDDTTLGHQYYIGMALGVCQAIGGVGVTLRRIFYDDREIWSGTAAPSDSGVAIDITLPEFLGGRRNGGGIVGRFRWYGGTSTQTASTYLSGFQSPAPAYRGIAYLVLEQVNVGESPRLDAFAVEVERYSNVTSLPAGDARVDGDAADTEMAIPAILAELLLDRDEGFALSLTDIDTASFATAAATLAAEGNGASLRWASAESIQSLITTLTRQADAVLRLSPTTGKWELKLVRPDYVVGNLLVLNASNVREVRAFSRAALTETASEVRVQYADRARPEGAPPAVAQDLANYAQTPTHRPLSVTYPGVWSAALAAKLAGRELRQHAFPLSRVTLVSDRAAWGMLPGDVFAWAWEPLGITQMVMRVIEISPGTPAQGEIEIQAVEDVFGVASALFAVPPASAHTTLSGAPLEVSVARVFDAPYYLARALGTATSSRALIVAQAPQGNARHFSAWARIGADPYSKQVGVAAYTPTGTLKAALAENTADTVTSFVVEGVAFAGALASSVGSSGVRAGQNLALIVPATGEPEVVGYETATAAGTEVTLGNVHRGLFDTLPVVHVLGSRVWFLTGSMAALTDVYGPTDTVDTRQTNVTATGPTDVATATTRSLTFRSRATLPLPPGAFKVNGTRYPANVAVGDITLTWARRDRTLGAIKFQDDADEALESGTDFEIKIRRGDTHALLRTAVVTGTSYVYTAAFQAADGGPFASYDVEARGRVTATLVPCLSPVLRSFTQS